MTYKIGSLFDGSGGFPLAGSMCGFIPTWASEVEPYPIAVTRSRFPDMKHLGDISKINGGEIKPVDVITFGSPCQDLSVAGKRAGLKHEANGDEETTRSGLFMEAVRIIKEMRKATNGKYPTFAVWENVPGAFSSNKGEDFRVVLEELIKIVEPAATVPPMPKGGWPYADCYLGDGWSLAYRTFDAQYWGVPKRRRRIHLVLDLRGERAGKVSFEREGVRGYFEAGRSPWKEAPGDAGDGVETADSCGLILDDQGGQQISVRTDGKSPTLRAEMHGNVPCVMEAAGFKAGQGAQARSIGWEMEKTPTLAAEAGGNSVPSVCIKQFLFENHSQDARYKGPLDVCPMLPAQLGTGGNNQPFVVEKMMDTIDCYAAVFAMQAFGKYAESETASAMKAKDYKDATDLVVECAGVDCRNMNEYPELYPTLQAKPNGGQSLNFSGAVRIYYIVRRLTPTECARLQGFVDRWGDIDQKEDFTEEEYAFWLEVRNTHAAINGKTVKEYTKTQMLTWYNRLHTDSAEYKMWGNGIALPPALYIMQGIRDALESGGRDG